MHQNAFDEVDTYTSLQKQYPYAQLILSIYERGSTALDRGADLARVSSLAGARDALAAPSMYRRKTSETRL